MNYHRLFLLALCTCLVLVAQVKISELASLSVTDDADVLAIVDTSATATKQITVANFFSTLLTRISSGLATDTCVIFKNGATIGCDDAFKYNGAGQVTINDADGASLLVLQNGSGQASILRILEIRNSSGTVLSSFDLEGSLELGSGSKLFIGNSGAFARWQTSNLTFANTGHIKWTATSPTQVADIGITRDAVGVLRISDGSSGYGKSRVSAIDIEDTGLRPTCDVSQRGTMWFDEGGSGIQDSMSICAKDAGDVYAWRTVY